MFRMRPLLLLSTAKLFSFVGFKKCRAEQHDSSSYGRQQQMQTHFNAELNQAMTFEYNNNVIPGVQADVTQHISSNIPPATLRAFLEGVQKRLKFLKVKEQIPGLSVAIVFERSDPIVINWGYSDVSTGVMVQNNTMFRLGKLSELITMYYTYYLHHKLQLGRQNQNQNLLTTRISRLLNTGFTDARKNAITIQQLLEHTSRLADLNPNQKTFRGSVQAPDALRLGDTNAIYEYINGLEYQTEDVHSRNNYTILMRLLQSLHETNNNGGNAMETSVFARERLRDFFSSQRRQPNQVDTRITADYTLDIIMHRSRQYTRGTSSRGLAPQLYQSPAVFLGAHGFLSTTKALAYLVSDIFVNRGNWNRADGLTVPQQERVRTRARRSVLDSHEHTHTLLERVDDYPCHPTFICRKFTAESTTMGGTNSVVVLKPQDTGYTGDPNQDYVQPPYITVVLMTNLGEIEEEIARQADQVGLNDVLKDQLSVLYDQADQGAQADFLATQQAGLGSNPQIVTALEALHKRNERRGNLQRVVTQTALAIAMEAHAMCV